MDRAENGYVNSVTTETGITTISFFHPAQNSLPGALLSQLAKAIRSTDKNPLTKVIVLKSDGDKAFCAGASFDELLQISTKEQGLEFFSGFAHVINACRASKHIVIGRVHGKAIGGGVGISAAADHCFATDNASIKLSELSIGIGPFVIEPAVTRKIGINAFTQLTLNPSEFYTAQWAREKGLYSEVFETRQQMDLAIDALIQKMISWNPEALVALKQTLWQGTGNWTNLLTERAAISGSLVLSQFAQSAISTIKPRK